MSSSSSSFQHAWASSSVRVRPRIGDGQCLEFVLELLIGHRVVGGAEIVGDVALERPPSRSVRTTRAESFFCAASV